MLEKSDTEGFTCNQGENDDDADSERLADLVGSDFNSDNAMSP